ncbi:MAG TPA: UdgX family uracil-DNA binding protein [Myxococcales bacterium]|jgi:DNA polymerase
MAKRQSVSTAAPLVPPSPTLAALREAAAKCQACPLYAKATQTVFGDGEAGASLMFVGEQPSDKEDLSGKPFVGPSGKLLDQGLAKAGIDRKAAYVTNVVKHFKFAANGKRRIHAKPNSREIAACRPWLDAEIAVVRPKVLVCLGATAAMALLGKDFRVTERRGQMIDSALAAHVVATVHPSSILRAPDPASRQSELERFFADLALIGRVLRSEA